MSNKEQILALRKANPAMKISEIVKIVGCARITVRRHLDPKENRDKAERRKGYRKRLVIEHGGKCKVCAYSKCIDALEFHHPNTTAKKFNVSGCSTFKQAQNEAAKCILLCANCHREIHAELKERAQGQTIPYALSKP